MGLFNSREEKNLTKLISTAADQDKVMTLDELYGFLFGLAIIPEMLVPSQWMPIVFGGEEMCDIDDEKEGERLLGSLFSAYNRINSECSDGKFVFPYDVNRANADDIASIRKWCEGLYWALCKSSKINRIINVAVQNSKDDTNIDSGTFAVSYAILKAVAFPGHMPESVERMRKEATSDVTSIISDENFISMLPEAVSYIRWYARTVQKAEHNSGTRPSSITPTAPLKVEKVGRNDTCHCGSGNKYKKCCGK